MTRVLQVVVRCGSSQSACSMPSASSSRRRDAAAASAPHSPASRVRTPRRARLRATLAAPPGTSQRLSTRATGMGASGEMRSTVALT